MVRHDAKLCVMTDCLNLSSNGRINVVQSNSWTWSVFMVRHDAAYLCVMTDYINSQRHDGQRCASWRKKHEDSLEQKAKLFCTVRHDARLCVMTDYNSASWRTICASWRRNWISFWISRQNSFALSVVTHQCASWRTDGIRRDAKLCVMTEALE